MKQWLVCKDSLQNGRKILPAIHLTTD
jgi:hypothetical protein